MSLTVQEGVKLSSATLNYHVHNTGGTTHYTVVDTNTILVLVVY